MTPGSTLSGCAAEQVSPLAGWAARSRFKVTTAGAVACTTGISAATAEKEACFHLSFRRNPFGGGFAVACGLAPAIEYIENLRFQDGDLEYLAGLVGNDGRPLFEPGFLDHLRALSFRCDLDAVPEGTVVFAQEPLVRVTGPLLAAQLLETPLLNLINFQTLIATKAARLRLAAGDDPILE